MLKAVAVFITSLFLIFSSFSFSDPQKLIITGSSAWYPYSFINEKGKADGILIDFWRLYARENNKNIEFHLMPWNKSLEYMKNHSNAIHAGLGYTESRAKFLAFSHELPIPRHKVTLFAKEKLTLDNISMLSSESVGLVEQSVQDEFIRSRLPTENVKRFPNFETLFTAVKSGEIDYFINDHDSSIYYLHKNNEMEDFVAKQILFSFTFHFAVNKESKDLVRYLEKGLLNVPPLAVKAMYQKWFQDDLSNKREIFNLEILTAITLLIFGVGLIFYRHKLKLCKAKLQLVSAELEDTNNELKKILETDALTGAKTRHQFFAELENKRFSNSPYTVAVISINGLKRINERYGQDIGDMVLKHFTYQLKWKFGNFYYARLCGGEFAILFDSIDTINAQEKLINLQRNLKLNPLYVDQQNILIEISTGIAAYPYDDKRSEVLVRRAAERMRKNREAVES